MSAYFWRSIDSRFGRCAMASSPTGCVSPSAPTTLQHRRQDVDPQAIFDYLYFHVIPAPRTVFKGVQRLPAGHVALFDRGTLTVTPYWEACFEEGRREELKPLKETFRKLLRDCVADQVDNGRGGLFSQRRNRQFYDRGNARRGHRPARAHVFDRLRRCRLRRDGVRTDRRAPFSNRTSRILCYAGRPRSQHPRGCAVV